VSAIEQPKQEVIVFDTTESRSRIPKDLIEQLQKLYPYVKRPTGKQRILRSANAAVESIDSLAGRFGSKVLLLTLPMEYVKEINNSESRRYAIPTYIKILLAKLAIEIGNNNL
jgi:hypothetical protein